VNNKSGVILRHYSDLIKYKQNIAGQILYSFCYLDLDSILLILITIIHYFEHNILFRVTKIAKNIVAVAQDGNCTAVINDNCCKGRERERERERVRS
jgi:hypothetical protein